MDSPSSVNTHVQTRGARGALALAVRQVLVQGLSVAAAIVLARVLTPAEFGIYGITVFLMHFLVVFGDAGLAAGLVREHAEPDDRDYRAVFTFQQVLVSALAVLGIFLSAPLSALLAPDGGAEWLLPAVILALVLASFQTMPAARLERHLRFDKLAIVEVGQAVAFNGVVVGCALAGVGADSMAAALVARAAVGALLVQVVAPWSIAWAWDWSRVRSRLRFGMSFQGAALVGLVREALVPVFVGATLGSAAVGGIFFASMLATYVLVVVSMLQRLMMPLFARLQDRPDELARAVESTLFAVSAFVVPVQVTVWTLQEPITRIVFGQQWVASLDVYRWMWVGAVFEPHLFVALSLLNALGRADRTFRLMAVTSVVTWVAGVPLLLAFGPIGIGIANVLLLAIKWPLLREADLAARTRSLAVIAPTWAAGAVSVLATAVAATSWAPVGLGGLTVLIALSLAVYAASLALLSPVRCGALLGWWRVATAAGTPAYPEESR